MFGTGKGLAHNYKRCAKRRCKEPVCKAADWGYRRGYGAGSAGAQQAYAAGYQQAMADMGQQVAR